ncbi:hypothetical protein [Myxacorys almedinensis]|uniref:Uncharacterized protein n=1 Tax=Myxacorys almedinensis A TaxID=2690445 RepID=A0A8J7YWW5_9CYAN|nr:hypothetical protein [Myxacorys almedinensis]NDJ16137.1 hypothetical protein [Myxacorys almedinensis A]
MTQDSRPPIELSVHESADPNAISANPEAEASSKTNDLNNSVHDDENVDVPIPGLDDDHRTKTLGDDQITTVNRSAG